MKDLPDLEDWEVYEWLSRAVTSGVIHITSLVAADVNNNSHFVRLIRGGFFNLSPDRCAFFAGSLGWLCLCLWGAHHTDGAGARAAHELGAEGQQWHGYPFPNGPPRGGAPRGRGFSS